MSPVLSKRKIAFTLFYATALAVVFTVFHFWMSSETVGKVLVWVASLFTIVSFTSTLLLRTIADTGSVFSGVSEEVRRNVDVKLGELRSKVVTQILKVITLILVAVLLGFYMQDRAQTRWMQYLDFASWLTFVRVVFFELAPSCILVHAIVEIYRLFVTYDEAERNRGILGSDLESIRQQQASGLSRIGKSTGKDAEF